MPVEVQGEQIPIAAGPARTSKRPLERWLEPERSALVLTIVIVLGVAAAGALVGADAGWLAALGQWIAGHGSIPNGVPFAAAPTAHWHNAIVLSELLFHWIEAAFGNRGLVLAQLAAILVAVIAMTHDARADGASPEAAGTAILLASLGGLASLLIVRVQLFSLALFPVLVALLRSECRRPSWRIWLVVPLVAVWSNLHGAVLIGLAITFGYLLLARLRRDWVGAVGVALVSIAALAITPAGLSTFAYYHGVLTNEAAARGAGLWAPLMLTKPLDVLLLLVALALAIEAWRAKPPPWEVVVTLGLAVETVQASRSGVWVLLFLAPRAANGIRRTGWWSWVVPPLATIALVSLVLATIRGPLPSGAGSAMVRRAIALARGTPILASDIIDEQVALAGGRIWVGNPIDAFSKADQSTYLDWIDGNARGSRALTHGINVVLTTPNSAAQRLMALEPGFVRVGGNGRAILYFRAGEG